MDIKERKRKEKDIKILDRTAISTEKFKEKLVSISKRESEETPIEYSSQELEKIYSNVGIIPQYSINKFKDKIINKKLTKNQPKKEVFKEKKSNRTIKIKPKQKSKNNDIKNNIEQSKKVFQKTKIVVEKIMKGVKKTAQASIVLIKGIIASFESLLSFLLAGGWIAVLIIVVICMIGLLLNSIYGIFFINEINESRTITSVITEINQETYEKIENLKSFYPYAEYVIEPNNINWRNVISIYAVKYSEDNELTSLTILTEDNIKKLKDVYWDMNSVKVYYTNQVINQYETKKILHIIVESKSIEEISQQYKFMDKQKQELVNLLSNKNDSLWGTLIYGTNTGNYKLVDIARQQIGNKGGEEYWRWYGFDKRVAWCAIFVSWVANEAGELNITVPKFSLVSDGVNWYKQNNRWNDNDYIPKAGDIIFFDWEQDKKVNHVGLVEKVENNTIYTIEGNSTGDQCLEQEYEKNDKVIYGYGITA